VLLARLDRAGMPAFCSALGALRDLAEELLLVAARALERALEHAVALRVQRAEAEVLELELEVVQPSRSAIGA
jgi:hypothetical protein